MDTANYNEDLLVKLDKLESYKTKSYEATIRIANEIMIIANRRNDLVLRSLCQYYIARYYYNMKNCAECIHYLTKAIEDAQDSEAWLEYCRSMTLLASTFIRQGNIANAMQALASSIAFSEKNVKSHSEFAHILIRSYSDLANLCYDIGDYNQAMQYELASDRFFYLIERTDFYILYYIRHLASLVKIYLMVGNSTNAGDVIQQIDNLVLANSDKNLEPFASIVHILWNEYSGNHKWDDVYMDRLNSYFRGRTFKGEHIWEYFYTLGQMVYNENYRDYFRGLVAKMDSYLAFSDLYGYLNHLCNIKLNYFEYTNQEEKRIKELENFREYSNATLQAGNRAMSIAINIRTMGALDPEIRQSLERRSNEDDLTGLPNRKSFNDMADRFFERCLGQKTNLAVVLLTIDNIKRINDLYGYSIGDRCLVELANVLKRHVSEHFYIARYISAEFVILIEGMKDMQIIKKLLEIHNDMLQQISKLDLPEFTLAEGICAHVPAGLNKIWDYTSCADMALLKAMQHGTGQSVLVHSIQNLGDAKCLTLSPSGKTFSEKTKAMV
jgi:diguanylate cyclase (GGDEF)-like protein